MLLKVWRFATLLLAALALTMTSAHVLEMPQKMRYDLSFYAAVNGTLYRHFATVGAVYTLGSIAAAAVLVALVRHRGATLLWTAVGAACLLLAFGSWVAIVVPVNLEVSAAMREAPQTLPALWARLRPRWEYGHLVGFVLGLAGFGALLASVLVETPGSAPRASRS